MSAPHAILPDPAAVLTQACAILISIGLARFAGTPLLPAILSAHSGLAFLADLLPRRAAPRA